MNGRLLPCGETALLVEVETSEAVAALVSAVNAAGWPGVIDVVPAARTLLIEGDSPSRLATIRAQLGLLLQATAPTPPVVDAARTVEILVVYDGPDLDEVSQLTGLGRAELIAAHTGTPWRVAFGGFAPGFAYLTGGDPRLAVPRRSTPRAAVPAGAVGLAGEFSGVYPRSSPGGWQLIGHTDTAIFDTDRDPPALLRPGWSVRFLQAPP